MLFRSCISDPSLEASGRIFDYGWQYIGSDSQLCDADGDDLSYEITVAGCRNCHHSEHVGHGWQHDSSIRDERPDEGTGALDL